MDTNQYIEGIMKLLHLNRDKEKAKPMKSYMKNHFEFFGIPSPQRKEIFKQFFIENGYPEYDDLHTVINLLWDLPEREYQYFALSILDKRKKDLTSEDVPFLEYLIVTKSWWDTIDAISPNYIGIIFKENPTIIDDYVKKWLDSENIWLKRSAILYQLKYKKDTNEDRLFHIITNLAQSDEFFIRKAIGWALREYSKTNPSAVITFVTENENKLSSLSKREGLKVIAKKKKEAVDAHV
jgi:3-methyladenine DNA glycosylase AlkD